MSAPKSSAVVVPTGTDGAPDATKAAALTKMSGGGLVLSPLPLGGGKRRKTRRLSKKVLKMLKAMPKKKLAKLMKGGQEAAAIVTGKEGEGEGEGAESGAARKTRKGKKASRRSGIVY